MTDPEKPEDTPAHESLFGQAAAETAPATVIDHDPPSPPPPAAPTIIQRRGGTPLLLTLLITAGLGGGIYWVWTNPKPVETAAQPAPVTAPAAAPAPDPDTLAKLQALADRVDKLEKAPMPEAPQPAPAQPATEQAAPAPPSGTDATVALSKKLDDVTGQLSAISGRQDQLTAELAKVQELAAQKPADTGAPPPDHAAQEAAAAASAQAQQQLADLGGKTDQALTLEKNAMAAIAQRLDKLEQADQSAALSQTNTQVSALDSRIGKLEQSEGQLQGATKDANLAIKLEAAQAALAAGKPLGDLPGAPTALQRFATTAPPTEAALRADFPKISAAILAASRPEEAQTTFLSRALARVEQSVTVRQGDHVIVGDPAAGVVARAQADLASGDLAGAAAALGALTGRAADAAKTWRAQAQALVDARAALLALAAHG